LNKQNLAQEIETGLGKMNKADKRSLNKQNLAQEIETVIAVSQADAKLGLNKQNLAQEIETALWCSCRQLLPVLEQTESRSRD